MSPQSFTVRKNLCENVNAVNFNSLLDQIDAVLFDCDGTLWRGPELLPGSVQFVNSLLAMGKRVGYITNYSGRTHAEQLASLHNRGFPTPELDLVMCTAHSAAIHLAQGLPEQSRAFVVGPPSVVQELRDFNIDAFTEEDFDGDFSKLKADAVVCALDREFNYRKMAMASYLLSKNKDAIFLATNLDSTYPEAGGRLSPDCGPIVGAISISSGRQLDVCVGKPSSIMFDQVADKVNLDPTRVLVIGDRCETDMAFATTMGAYSMMVQTGVSSVADAKENASSHDGLRTRAPHFIAPSVEFLGELLA